jgi:hypothetical protein
MLEKMVKGLDNELIIKLVVGVLIEKVSIMNYQKLSRSGDVELLEEIGCYLLILGDVEI